MATTPQPLPQPAVEQGGSLAPLLTPKTVAVIGATETPGSVGRTVTWNLLAQPFGGVVYPVHPNRTSVLGVKAWPRVSAIPDQIDLAVVVTPATTVPGIIAECAQCGVRAAIIISAGFAELGPAGARLTQDVLAHARRGGMRILGPNCLGLANPQTGLNATFAGTQAKPGHVAFLSQSGALGCAVLDWAEREGMGFSGFASVGAMLDVGWADLLDWYARDPRTTAIALYLESVGDARTFCSAIREAARSKPVVAIKAGRTVAGAAAAAVHTGADAGDDAVIDAALDQAGVIRVDRIDELFAMADLLGKAPRPAGARLGIVTNAGGPGVLAVDALIHAGATLATLHPDTIDRLDHELKLPWSRANPVDILGDADPARFRSALEATLGDPAVDGLLAILTPQDMTDGEWTATVVVDVARQHPQKPVLAAWMGGAAIEAGRARLAEAGIPVFPTSDAAAQAFARLANQAETLRALYATTGDAPRTYASSIAMTKAQVATGEVLGEARRTGRTLLTEAESKDVLAAYDVPVTATVVASNQAEAVAAAKRIGYPVAVKLHSRTVGDKSAVGGVRLGLTNPEQVKAAVAAIEEGVYTALGGEHFHGVTVQPHIADGIDVLIRVSQDPQFGPVLSFGLGGALTGLVADLAMALPPLTTPVARRLVGRTRIGQALESQGRHGRQLGLANAGGSRVADQLAHALVQVGRLVVNQPWIREIEINPVRCGDDGAVALDARITLHPSEIPLAQLPRPALRPYPLEWEGAVQLKDQTRVQLRPVTAEDEPLMAALLRNLGERTMQDQDGQPTSLGERLAHDRLADLCQADYDREIAVTATLATTGECLALGRLSRRRLDRTTADLRLVVADRWHRRGLGSSLLGHLIAVARREGLRRIEAIVPTDRPFFGEMCRKVGFTFEAGTTNLGLLAVLVL